MPGLYIHIPFCKQACHYCDFHFSTQTKYIDRMVDAMLKEIEMRQKVMPQKVDSIYFGGGTPSILGVHHLQRIFEKLSANVSWEKDAEITLEANPDDMSKENLAAWKRMGINRLSVGIQSFFEEDLKQMNRAHTASEAEECIQNAVEEGFEHFTIDLIYGLPWSTMEKWQANVKRALELPIQHVSAYCLTIEENTVFDKWSEQQKIPSIDDQQGSEEYLYLQKAAPQHGFEQYEVSNFAKKGHRAQHNSSYWRGEDYIAIGPGAHGLIDGVRYFNIAHNIKYMHAIEKGALPQEIEKLDTGDRYNELVMTGLRTIDGVDLQKMKQLGPSFYDYILKELEQSRLKEYVTMDENVIKVKPPEGFHYADAIARDLFWVG